MAPVTGLQIVMREVIAEDSGTVNGSAVRFTMK
jgi:hypothetical protein